MWHERKATRENEEDAKGCFLPGEKPWLRMLCCHEHVLGPSGHQLPNMASESSGLDEPLSK